MPIRNGKYVRWMLVAFGVIALLDWFVIPLFLGLPIMAEWR